MKIGEVRSPRLFLNCGLGWSSMLEGLDAVRGIWSRSSRIMDGNNLEMRAKIMIVSLDVGRGLNCRWMERKRKLLVVMSLKA